MACSAVFSWNVSAIRTSTSTSVAADRKTAASIVWWKWSATSSPPAMIASSDGVTSMRQPSSATGRGARSGLHAAAAIRSGESRPSTGTHSARRSCSSPDDT